METRKIQSENTQKLIKVCQFYLDHHASYFGTGATLKKIAGKIIRFYDDQPDDVSQKYLELMSTCIVYALKPILKTLNSNNFARLLNDEFKGFDLPTYEKDQIKMVISHLINRLAEDEYEISTDLNMIPVKIEALLIDLTHAKMDDTKLMQKCLLDLHSLPILNNCSHNDALNLLDAISIAIVKTEKLHYLQEFAIKFYKEEKTRKSEPIAQGHYKIFWMDLFLKKAFIATLDIKQQPINYSSNFFVSQINHTSPVPSLTFKLLEFAEQIHDYETMSGFWVYVAGFAIHNNHAELIQKILRDQPKRKPDREYVDDCFDKLWTIPVLAHAVDNHAIGISKLIIDECGKDLLLSINPYDFDLNINRDADILNATIITDSFDLLKLWIPQFLEKRYGTHNPRHQIEQSMIAKAVEFGKKEMLAWLLQESGIFINDEILYKGAKTFIGVTKTEVHWEIIKLIYNHNEFNPDYCLENKYQFLTNEPYVQKPLIQLSHDSKCDKFTLMLLQHPRLNLDNIKNDYLAGFVKKEQYDFISCLMYNPRFFALEEDWLQWSKKNLGVTDNLTLTFSILVAFQTNEIQAEIEKQFENRLPKNIFTEIVNIFHCWHSLNKIQPLKSVEDQFGLPKEIFKLIQSMLYQTYSPKPAVAAIVSQGLFSAKTTTDNNKDCEMSIKSKRI